MTDMFVSHTTDTKVTYDGNLNCQTCEHADAKMVGHFPSKLMYDYCQSIYNFSTNMYEHDGCQY